MTIEIAELERLVVRVLELERRVAALESGFYPVGWAYHPPLNNTRDTSAPCTPPYEVTCGHEPR